MDGSVVRRGTEVTIYGLPHTLTEDECVQEFKRFGNIKDIDRNSNDGSFTVAFQRFSEAAALEKYLKEDPIPEGNFVNPMMAMPMNPMMNPMLGGAMMGGGPMMGNPMMMNMLFNQMAMGCPTPMTGLSVTRSPGGTAQPSPNFVRTVTNAGTSPNMKSQSSDSSLENGHELQTGPCIRCKRRTTYTCGRCGGFYCSRDCQKQDWPDHKTDCNNQLPMLNFAGRKLISEIELLDNDARACNALSPRSSTQEPRGRDQRDHHDNRNQRGQRDNREQRVHREDRDQGLSDRMPDGRQISSQPREQGGTSDDRQFRRHGGTSGDDRNRMNSNGPNPRFSDQRNDSSNNGSFCADRQNNRQGDDGFCNRNQGGGSKFGSRNGSGGPRNQNDGENRSGRRDGDRRQQGSHRGAFNFHEQRDRNGQDFKDLKSPVEVAVTKVESPPHVEKIDQEISVAKIESPPHVEKIDKEISVTKIESPPSKQSAEVKESASVGNVSKLFAGLKLNRAPATAIVESAPKVEEPKMPEARVDKPADVSVAKGDKVIISHVAHSSIYLQPFSNLPELAKLITGLQEHCVTAPTLTRAPKKKEFLAAKFSADESFYRAVVEARTDKDEQKYRVRFVDFGNDEDGVTWDRMVLLSDDLASFPCLAIETHLQGVPQEALMKEAAAIVKECNKNETILTLEFTSSITDGVTLKMDDGSSVNEKVLQALTPIPVLKAANTPTPAPATSPAIVSSPPPAPASAGTPVPIKAAAEPSQHYMYDEVKNVPFPAVGTKTTIMINYVQDTGVIMACPAIQSAIEATSALNQKLMEYAPSAQPFRPTEAEVCAAKWTDDCWYRAVCVELKGNDTFRLMFLEFGNIDEVKYPNIVPLTEELVREQALSSMCQLSGPELTPSQVKKLQDLINSQGWAGEAVVEANPSDGMIILNIPALMKEL